MVNNKNNKLGQWRESTSRKLKWENNLNQGSSWIHYFGQQPSLKKLDQIHKSECCIFPQSWIPAERCGDSLGVPAFSQTLPAFWKLQGVLYFSADFIEPLQDFAKLGIPPSREFLRLDPCSEQWNKAGLVMGAQDGGGAHCRVGWKGESQMFAGRAVSRFGIIGTFVWCALKSSSRNQAPVFFFFLFLSSNPVLVGVANGVLKWILTDCIGSTAHPSQLCWGFTARTPGCGCWRFCGKKSQLVWLT